MASTFSATNISHMNQKQLRKVATDLRVSDITVINNSNSQNGKAALITAIKAK